MPVHIIHIKKDTYDAYLKLYIYTINETMHLRRQHKGATSKKVVALVATYNKRGVRRIQLLVKKIPIILFLFLFDPETCRNTIKP